MDPRKVHQNLLKKGFAEIQKTKHLYYVFEFGEIRTDIQTFVSRNKQEIGNELISEMKDQLHLTKKEFIDLIDCNLSEEDYIKILKDKNLLMDNE
jgi:trans-2-enoyl-CoA reductase